MKKTILLIAILITGLLAAQTPSSTMKGYYLQKVGDSVVGQNSRPDKAFFDLYNYMKERGIKKGIVTSPYWEINIDYPDTTTTQPPVVEPPKDTTIVEPPKVSDVFVFNPDEYGIVQGKVNDSIALDNRNKLQAAIDEAHKIGDSLGFKPTFKIPAMDAYFNANSRTDNRGDKPRMAVEGIVVPSNMTIEMSDDTYLRVQPNDRAFYNLFILWDVDNVTIRGGHLIGDKYEHDYITAIAYNGVDRSTHEYGFLIAMYGAHNVIIDNVDMKDATGDNIIEGIKWIRNADGTITDGNKTCENIYIRNCNISGARRNNISIVDSGATTYIYNNNIKNAGEGEGSGHGWWGTPPRANIDLECTRTRLEDGTLAEYARVEYVDIFDNIFSGAVNKDIVLYTCSFVKIYNNKGTRGIYNYAAHDVEIYSNYMESEGGTGMGIALQQYTIGATGEQLCYNYKVYGNTLKGFQYGIGISLKDAEVYGNTYIDNTNIGLSIGAGAENIYVHDETITSTSPNSFGVRNWITSTEATDIKLERLKVNTVKCALRLEGFKGLGSGMTITDSEFKATDDSDVRVVWSSNIQVSNSVYSDVVNRDNTNVIIP
ncbi:hypothetical protein [Tenacibaculum sp.]|uniref:hypothetical protein n=1 Tax=Tenacibaculum sp. TaxID=1906242 RepID=UPI003D136223